MLGLQVRDWFKDRRTEEEAPKIVEEKKTELLLSNGNNVKVKQEPLLELEEEAIGNKDVTNNVIGNNEEMVRVKTEPLEEEGEGPVSAVLRSKVIIVFLKIRCFLIIFFTGHLVDVSHQENRKCYQTSGRC